MSIFNFFNRGADNSQTLEPLEPLFIDYFQQRNIQLDDTQKHLIGHFETFNQQLQQFKTGKKNKYSIKKSAKESTQESIIGLYLWGGVGRGKTVMMDAFMELTDYRYKRYHHHELFQQLMSNLKRFNHKKNPLASTMQHLLQDYQLLGFDDLHLHDIADAKLWQGVFQHCLEQGVGLIITSNTHPQNLLDTPGYREKIQPLLNTMCHHLQVLNVDAGIDYRQQNLLSEQWDRADNASMLVSPKDTQQLLYHCFGEAVIPTIQSFQAVDKTNSKALQSAMNVMTIQNRPIYYWYKNETAIVISFNQLFTTFRNYADYLELTENYNQFIILCTDEDNFNNSHTLKRFVWFIDIAYDRSIHLNWVSNSNPIEQMQQQQHSKNQPEQNRADLPRTLSRLIAIFGIKNKIKN